MLRQVHIVKYAFETWIITTNIEKKIHAFQMWCYHRIDKITGKVRNEEILRRVGMTEKTCTTENDN